MKIYNDRKVKKQYTHFSVDESKLHHVLTDYVNNKLMYENVFNEQIQIVSIGRYTRVRTTEEIAVGWLINNSV